MRSMTLEVGRGTRAGVHTVFAIEALGAYVVAVVSHPARQANAVAIVLAAAAMILAATTLRAALAEGILRAGLVAVGASPAWQAQALSIHMVALGLMLAIAFQMAVGSIQTRRAGVLTGGTHVAGTTDHFARDMIAGCIAWWKR